MKAVVVFACYCDDDIKIADLNAALQEVASENGGRCPHVQEVFAGVEEHLNDQVCAVVASRQLTESECEVIRRDFQKNLYHKQIGLVRNVFRVEIPDAPPIVQSQ